jgi:hypothetical protein
MDGVYTFADGSQLTLAEMIDRKLARESDSTRLMRSVLSSCGASSATELSIQPPAIRASLSGFSCLLRAGDTGPSKTRFMVGCGWPPKGWSKSPGARGSHRADRSFAEVD